MTDELAAFLAVRISSLVLREQPALWNLVAPPELLTNIVDHLAPRARARLTKTQGTRSMPRGPDEIRSRFGPATVVSPG